jgi:hypothetical protein
VSAFDPRDRRLTDAGPSSEVGLAPSASNADETDSASESLVAHPRSVASGSSLPINWPRIHRGTVRPGSRAHAGEPDGSPRTTDAPRRRNRAESALPHGPTVWAWISGHKPARCSILATHPQLIHSKSPPLHSDGGTSHTGPRFVHARSPPVHEPINSQTTTPSGVPTNPTTTSCGFRLTTPLWRRIVSGSLRTIRVTPSETPAGPQSPARQPRNRHQSVGDQGNVAATATSTQPGRFDGPRHDGGESYDGPKEQ